MNFLNYFRLSPQKNTASLAKERLRIIVEHERRLHNSPNLDYLPLLQKELLEVVRKYVAIEDEHISIHLERNGDFEVLELNITLPDNDNSRKDSGKS